MAKERITDVVMDDASINVSKEVDLVFSIANSLRGAYKSDKYKDVIIPMIIIRRFECALANTKDAVVTAFEAKRDVPPQILEKIAGYKFYNTSRYTLAELLNEPDNIVSNFNRYIEGFSVNVQSIIRNLDFEKEIDKMDKNNRLLGVVRKFSELDLNPTTVDGIKAGYMFEEIIRKFSENAEAGDHYTPREVIRLLVSILLAEGLDDLYTERRVATVLDMACGSGGMLSTTYNAITRMNPDAEVRLFGQEINPESYAICLADMLIKGEDAKNIHLQDTMKADCFEGQDMRIVIINPPFGQAWGGKDAADGVESAVKKEHKKAEKYEGAEKMEHSRFPWGLPTSGDMQLLFMQHAIYKMSKDGRAAIISNGSPLFSGNTTSGESQIRRYMLENDLIEAIVALPNDLFYNTSIGIYAFILSKNKRSERRGKIQLINAVDMWKPLRKSLGKKRKEISKDDIARITEIYAGFEEGPYCKIFDNEEFMYKEYAVYQPLQRRGSLSAANITALKTSATFTANSFIFNEADYEVLLETDPREGDDEKKFQKYQKGKEFTEAVIVALEAQADDTEYDDFAKFVEKLKEIIGDIDGMSPSRLNAIAMEMSVMDKNAVVQKDKKGNVITDPTTKDTELIGLRIDLEEYFKREVYPQVPDALYAYEYDPEKKATSSNRERLGAELPFTRYFYQYKAPEKADVLLERYLSSRTRFSAELQDIDNVMVSISALDEQLSLMRDYRHSLINETVTKGLNKSVAYRDSGIPWIGEIPSHWKVRRIRHIIQPNVFGIRVGPFGSSLTEAVVSEEYGSYKVYGQANLIRQDFNYGDNFVKEADYNRLKNYEVLPGDVLLSMMGTIGRCAVVPMGIKAGIMDSHLIKIRLSDEMFPAYFEFVYDQSEVVYEQLLLNSKGSIMNGLNSGIVKNIYVPVPPISEQIAIAEFLEAKCPRPAICESADDEDLDMEFDGEAEVDE